MQAVRITKDTIEPWYDFIVLQRRRREQNTGLIYLPDSHVYSSVCEVAAVGPGRENEDGTIRPMFFKKGQTVFVFPYDAEKLDELNDPMLGMGKESQVAGIFHKDPGNKDVFDEDSILHHFTPVGGRVIVQLEDVVTQTSGGLFLPDSAVKKQGQRGRVVNSGLGRVKDDGTFEEAEFKIGDLIGVEKYTGAKIQTINEAGEKKEYLFIEPKDIFVTFDPEIKPIKGSVLAQKIEPEEKIGSIYKPDTVKDAEKEAACFATVVRSNSDKVAEGEVIIFEAFSGQDVRYNDVTYTVVNEDYVVGNIRDVEEG